MAHPLVVVAMIVLGFFIGSLLNTLASWMEKVNLGFLGGGPHDNLYSVFMGTFYFTAVFSIPLSGNIPLFIVGAAIFLYTLYGRFAAEEVEPEKPEDKVITKWYSGLP